MTHQEPTEEELAKWGAIPDFVTAWEVHRLIEALRSSRAELEVAYRAVSQERIIQSHLRQENERLREGIGRVVRGMEEAPVGMSNPAKELRQLLQGPQGEH